MTRAENAQAYKKTKSYCQIRKGDVWTVPQEREIAKSKADTEIEKAEALIRPRNAGVEK
jgi:hypothetical protein